MITNIVEPVRVFGSPAKVQAPQVPIVTAERAGELVVDGIVADRLLVVTDPGVRTMVERHASDPEGFLQSQIAYLEEGP